MRYLGYGTATAAAVAVAALAGLSWFGGRAVALERVIENVRKAESVTFTQVQKLGDQPPLEMAWSIRGHQARVEMGGGVSVLVLDTRAKKGLMLVPQFKSYERLGEGGRGTIAGPPGAQSPVEALLALKDRKPDSVAEEKLDGRVVQKLTIKGDPKADPPGDWVIWVDPKTELPVKMTYSGTALAGDREVPVVNTYEKFAWNVKLDDKLFSQEVPEGYTEGPPGRAPLPELLFVKAMDRVARATSMRAIITLDSGDGQTLRMKVYQQGESMRGETAEPGMVVVLDGKEKKGLLLFTQMKTAQRLDLTRNDMAAKIATQVADSMKTFDRLKGEKVAALPDETLDGRKLKAYEMKGVKVKEVPGETDIKVLIDPKTLLPAATRLQSRQGGKTITITLDVLGWNEDLDGKLFDLTVPPGFKVVEPPAKK